MMGACCRQIDHATCSDCRHLLQFRLAVRDGRLSNRRKLTLKVIARGAPPPQVEISAKRPLSCATEASNPPVITTPNDCRVKRWRGGTGFGIVLYLGFPFGASIVACRTPFPPPAHPTGRNLRLPTLRGAVLSVRVRQPGDKSEDRGLNAFRIAR